MESPVILPVPYSSFFPCTVPILVQKFCVQLKLHYYNINVSASQSGEQMRVPHSMWLCSRIMHALRDFHPTLLAALEGIVDQVCLHSWKYICLLLESF